VNTTAILLLVLIMAVIAVGAILYLMPAERTRFADAWKKAQARFVDQPSQAAADADVLVKKLMQTRGYPVGNFEERAADISVDHPDMVKKYRTAREIALRNNAGKATTEDIRQAMVRYSLAI
jgi:hypothetical protein